MQVRLEGCSPGLHLVFTGCFRNENPRRMSQELALAVVVEILLDYIKEVMMSESIWSAEIGVKCYLDDILITFSPLKKN